MNDIFDYDYFDLKEHPAMKYVDMYDDYDFYDDVELLYFDAKKYDKIALDI